MNGSPTFPRLALLLATALAVPAFASDDRIRELDYDPAAVVRLDGCFGFQTMVQFGPGERIENVGVGDASRWLIAPNKRADILFVKPSFADSHSNMTVATNRRVYNFELVAASNDACRRGRVVYTLRFRYPNEPEPTTIVADATPEQQAASAATDAVPAQRNNAYSFSGARGNVPQRVFDDGSRTWFHWDAGSGTPAVYAVGADQSETPVDFNAQGDWLVVDRIAPAFVLRRGNAVAVLYNDAWQAPTLDEASPQPRNDAGKSLRERDARKSLAAWFRDKESAQ
ncbi:MAG: TrbG/VirB9 family P-type conjugative transfer protein [Pseudoxanthomonas sp.]